MSLPVDSLRGLDSEKPEPAARVDVSRRTVLRAAAAGAGALLMAPAGKLLAAGSDANLAAPKTGAIDAHVHVWTPDVKAYPLTQGFAVADMQPPSFTPVELFDHARPCGVARIVLIQMSFYGFDNSYMLDSMKKYPGVFGGVAVIDSSANDVEKTMDGLRSRGVRGYRLYPFKRSAEQFFAQAGVARMWKHGAKTGQAMCLLINPADLPLANAMCGKHPDTPVVIDHFARIGIDGEIREADLKNLCNLARHKQTHVKISAFYALGAKKAPYDDLAPMIRRLVDAYGFERLMWATDCPYQVQGEHEYAPSIALVRDRLDFLSAGDREWLLRKTAEKVYFSA